jgi:hypothetical protein
VKDGNFLASPQSLLILYYSKLSCPQGTYLDQANYKCSSCPQGTYSDQTTYHTSCNQCPTNTYQSSSGQVSCKVCTAGSTYQSNTGQSFCQDCSKIPLTSSKLSLSSSLCGQTFNFNSTETASNDLVIDFSHISDSKNATVVINNLPRIGKIYQAVTVNGTVTKGRDFDDYKFSVTQRESQYASSVISCNAALTNRPCSAILGKPDVNSYGSSPNAWAPYDNNEGAGLITLGFDTSVFISGVVIYENFGAGAVTRLEAYDNQTQAWETFMTATPVEGFNVYRKNTPSVCPTTFSTNKIRVTLDASKVNGRNEIDAIALIGSTKIENSAQMVVTDSASRVIYEIPSLETLNADASFSFAETLGYSILSCNGLDQADGSQPLLVQLYKVSTQTILSTSRWVVGICMFLSIFGLVASIVGISFAIQKRDSVLMKASSSIFIIFMGVGSGVTFLYCLLLIGTFADPIKFAWGCYVAPYLSGISFTLVMGSSALKTYRLYQIFNGADKVEIRIISLKSLFETLAALISVELIIATVWIAADAPKVTLSLTNQKDVYLYKCTSPTSERYYDAQIVWRALVILVCGILVYKGRKVPGGFHEGRSIAFLIYNVIFLGVLYLIMRPLTNNSADYALLLQVLCISVPMFASLVLWIGLKVYLYFTRSEDDIKRMLKEEVRRISHGTTIPSSPRSGKVGSRDVDAKGSAHSDKKPSHEAGNKNSSDGKKTNDKPKSKSSDKRSEIDELLEVEVTAAPIVAVATENVTSAMSV